MKISYYAEIGLNYLGKRNNINQYLNYLSSNNQIDGVTIQILKNSFYKNQFKNYKISKSLLSEFVRKLKEKNKQVGVATNNLDRISEFKKLKFDFFKILSPDITEINLIKKLLNMNCKKIYLSTGMANYNKIFSVLKNIKKNKKKICLIHTSFKKNKKDINLNRINILKKKFKLPVSYGNHSRYLKSIIDAKKYNPSAIFFYVKLNKKLNYHDNIHAINLDKIEKYLLNS